MEKNPQELQKERVLDNVLISEILSIDEGGTRVTTREDLSKLVEAPLLEACEDLYDKNIETVMSGANAKDVGGEGHIVIAFDSLSEENKQIALKFGTPQQISGIINCITINFPIAVDTTVGDIRKMAREAVSQFHAQELQWGRTTLEELAKGYGIAVEDLTPDSFPDKYYDAKTGYLYDSKELYRKANNII